MSEKTEIAGSNNRWWESYLVRYFLGFIVGSICVAVIAHFSGLMPGVLSLVSGVEPAGMYEPKYGVTSIIMVIGFLGLAYCYLASTPITVLHAGRYRKGPADRLSRFFWFGWVLVLAVLMVFPRMATYPFRCAGAIYTTFLVAAIVFIVWRAINKFGGSGDDECKESEDGGCEEFDFYFLAGFFCVIWSFSQVVPLWLGVKPQIVDVRLFAIGAPVIWIGLAQYFVLFRILKSRRGSHNFYGRLFFARRRNGARDVRDTYSHLREHSNAIFIVAVEISMLALMLGDIRIQRETNIMQSAPLDGVTFWLSALGIWIVPTIFMWSQANAMEKYFAESPGGFIPEND
ncbi:hypothetical protein ACWKWV_07035 [Castellaniella ginsengisoli]